MVSGGQPVRKVAVFLVDGLRPDGLRLAQTPFMDGVLDRGAFTFRARSVMPTTTLPCHTSLFFSIPPEIHGIRDNVWQTLPTAVPGLVDVIHRQGLSAAVFYNWEPLRDLSRPESLAASCFLKDVPDDGGQSDREVTAFARAWLASHEWAFSFVYMHNTDKTGHRCGWMSDSYLGAISNADRCIEQICLTLPEDAVVIITSDHGGHDNTHHSDLEEDMTIPLMMYGPGIPEGREIGGQVSIMDVAPTVVRFLGLEPPEGWMGKAIRL
ncbi:MAG: alkaline phosphatase family protein [Thermodesulfobacteriota bacterium]